MALISDEEGKIPETLDLYGSFLDAATIAKIAVFGYHNFLMESHTYSLSSFLFLLLQTGEMLLWVAGQRAFYCILEHFNMPAAEDNKFKICQVYLHAPR